MELKLPDIIGGKRDLILATRQVEQILSDRLQDEVRQRFGAKQIGSNAGQRALQALLEVNKMMDDTDTLKRLLQNLEAVKQYAPKVRIAFSQEPEQDLYKRLISWFRVNVHPSVLVQVSVQPNLGGGFILQTGSHRYDLSLRTRILNSTAKFIEVLHRGEPEQSQTEPQQTTVQTTTAQPDTQAANMQPELPTRQSTEATQS